MKIRNGFVSNSSSSSFVIFGVGVDTSEIAELFKFSEDEADEISTSLEERLDGTGLTCVHDYDSSYVYIGCDPWSGMHEDETKAQFKARVGDMLKKLGITESPEYNEGVISS